MKEKFKHIFSILTPSEKRQFWVLIALNALISVIDLAALAFLLLVISFYINNSVKGLDFLPAWVLDQNSVMLITFFLIIFGLKNLLGISISNRQYSFISRVAVRISKNKLENYQRGQFENYINIDSSELIRKIAFQPFEFCEHILLNIQQVIIQSFLIVLTIAAILLYNVKLFLLLFVVLLPPVILVFFFIKKRVVAAKKNIHISNESSFRFLLDAMKGYVEGNIYQRNNFFLQRFIKARQVFGKHLFDSHAVQAMPTRIIETFAVIGLFFLIVIAKWSGINNNAALITIGAFMAAAYKIIPGIVKIINGSGQIKAYELSIDDSAIIKKGLKEEHVLKYAPIDSLKLEKVDFKYDDHMVLKNFSLSIKKGDFVGITGMSGRGKTTILNLILGFLSPASGKILINDVLVSPAELKKHWSGISYVRQQPFLIHDSILRNITLQENNYDEERLKQLLEISGLNDLIDSTPEGLNKSIAENGKNISGGQQQRINIARTLYKDAELILLDEPFNELDETSALSLVKYFGHLSSLGKIVIMITHDSKNLSYCNKIISLDEH
ncbi:MAG TPA: ABC transporter ATP-binding protein [Chitinophagaceae bacterium]|nr:ABC transporter ATP-binding protein [Chitinophagaceae bacterium]